MNRVQQAQACLIDILRQGQREDHMPWPCEPRGMCDYQEVLACIRDRLEGKRLIIGRKIGQEKFDILQPSLRTEAKPQKHRTGGTSYLGRTAFSVSLLTEILVECSFTDSSTSPSRNTWQILRKFSQKSGAFCQERGVLMVNSCLLDGTTNGFLSAQKQNFFRF